MSQFSAVEGKQTLADFFKVSKNVYPVGRLDYDSEGLLILTSDRSLNNKLLNPLFKHEREYWVEVEGAVTSEALQLLQDGVTINVDGNKYHTLPAKATLFDTPPMVPERNPPVRFRKNIPTSWIRLQLTEGKNRQVRRMTAAAGFPTLRLIRYRIEKIELDKMQPGDLVTMNNAALNSLLFK
jgi:23S rRNA pseudouridine2457 synthase